jgi:hypothetical protein
MSLTIRCIVDPTSGRVVDHPLPLDESGECTLWLDPVPGANAVEIAINSDGVLQALAEIATRPEEPVELRLRRLEGGRWRVGSDHPVRTMPLEGPAAAPLLRHHTGGQLQLFFLIDATARRVAVEGERSSMVPLLSPGRSAAWDDCVAALCSFAGALASRYTVWRTATLAYGDTSDDLAEVAAELRPRWAVYPVRQEERRPRPGDLEELDRRLASIPHSPGGDFVDALAEGMQACGDAAMRDQSRKLLVIFGDSPGHEVSGDAPRFADAQLRSCDVDEEAAKLFALGFEVVTIYNDRSDADPQGLAFKTKDWQDYLGFARRQYARLASLPGWAFERSRFQPEEAARRVLDRPVVIGRGACPGVLRG